VSIAARTFLVCVLVLVVAAVYAWHLNVNLLRDGCIGARGFPPDTGTVHFKAFPRGHFYCLYRTKQGRVLQSSQ